MATEKRLIDANELLEQIFQENADVFDAPPPGYCSLGGDDWGYSYDTIARIVRNAPTVDAVEVVHARWEWLGPNGLVPECMCGTCSACKVRSKYIVNTDICPNCGAKMDGERKQKENAE